MPARRSGRFLAGALFAAILALRVLCILHYRIDSDEPQHLHVVWGWTHHLVQYRDVFDNHTPLFHLACAPIFKLVGERADALIFMRFAMVPLFFFSLWCVYRLGIIIQLREVGFWGAVFAALSPGFCFTFTEYRTDDLWTALWLVSLVVMLGGALTSKRGLITGLLLGATVATSLKTLALLGCLGAAALAGLLLGGNLKAAMRDKRTYAFLGALLAGLAVVPGLLTVWFAQQDALRDALFGIFTFNSVPGFGRVQGWRDFSIGLLELLVTITVLVPISAWMARRLIAPQHQLRFHLIFLGSGFYGALLYTLWPLLDAEHFIPFHPLIILGIMPLILDTLARPALSWRGILPRALPAAAAFAIMALEARSVRADATAWSIEHFDSLLKMSNASDYIMDLKGESIFRQRPCPYLFEGVGVERARKGMVPDDIPERMIQTRTCITIHHNYRFILPRTLAFMDENYIPVGGYRVLGHDMTPVTGSPAFTFEVVIPESFAFVSKGKVISGRIDGQPCKGSAALAEGTHEFVPNRFNQRVAFVWKQAVDRGFYPKDRNYKQPAGRFRKTRQQSS